MCILQHSFCLCAWDYAIFSLFRSWHSTDLALLIAPSLLLLVCALWGSKWVSVCVCDSQHAQWVKRNQNKNKPARETATTAACNRFNMRCDETRTQEPFQESLEDDDSTRICWRWRTRPTLVSCESVMPQTNQPTSIVGNVVVVFVVGWKSFAFACVLIAPPYIHRHANTLTHTCTQRLSMVKN